MGDCWSCVFHLASVHLTLEEVHLYDLDSAHEDNGISTGTAKFKFAERIGRAAVQETLQQAVTLFEAAENP